MNPLTLLDSILADWASPRVRRTIHLTLLLIAALGTIWLSADGDWGKAVTALMATLYTGSNFANTPVAYEPTTSQTYAEAESDLLDASDSEATERIEETNDQGGVSPNP